MSDWLICRNGHVTQVASEKTRRCEVYITCGDILPGEAPGVCGAKWDTGPVAQKVLGELHKKEENELTALRARCKNYQDDVERLEKNVKDVRDRTLEEAAKVAERIWREADNVKADSALTSFRKNALSHGCVESAKAIRAMKGEGG